jgi:ribonuclease-3
MSIDELEAAIGVPVKRDLLTLALTHASFNGGVGPNYQRLEFLGDAILAFTVAELVYKRFPSVREDRLTRTRSQLVSTAALDAVGRSLGLEKHIRVQPGQDLVKQSTKIIADVVESILGAIYLTGGIEAAFTFVNQHIMKPLELGLEAGVDLSLNDPKTRLQEVSARAKTLPPVYETTFEGEFNERTYFCTVTWEGKTAKAEARSGKEAEKLAAAALLETL